LQPNVSLRELADKYNAARSEVIRLVLQEQEQKKIAASIAAGEAEAAPSRKKARMEGPVIVKNAVNAPRRSSRRSAAGRAKEKEAAQQKETTSAATTDDDSQPGPSTRNIRSRAQAKGQSSAKTNKVNNEEMDIDDGNCIEILSEEEEERKVKEEERSVDHDEDVDFTMESEEEEGNEDDDDELSPSPPLNKQRNLQQKQPPPSASAGGDAEGRSKPAADAAGTPQGFVPCPICGKSVPSFYINSHVDTCLSSGGGLASGSRGGLGPSEELDPGVETNNQNIESPLIPPSDPAQSSAAIPTQNKSYLGNKKPLSSREGPYIPLAVPPSLVPSLASDKIIRAALKKYSLPSDGKKSEMFDRYSQFRTAVLTANDRQERTSYAKIAQEMAAQERQRAAAALLGGPGNGNNGKFGAGATGGVFRQGNGNHRPSSELNYNNKIGNGQKRGGDPMVLQGDSFEELIAVTKARDAARRAARAAAAAEEEEEEQKVDRFNTLRQQDSPVYPAPTSPQFMEVSPSYQPIFPEEEAEKKEAAAVGGEDEKQAVAVHVTPAGDTGPPAAAAAAAAPDAVPNTREKMLAEEVRQAHEIGLLDSDDDNW